MACQAPPPLPLSKSYHLPGHETARETRIPPAAKTNRGPNTAVPCSDQSSPDIGRRRMARPIPSGRSVVRYQSRSDQNLRRSSPVLEASAVGRNLCGTYTRAIAGLALANATARTPINLSFTIRFLLRPTIQAGPAAQHARRLSRP